MTATLRRQRLALEAVEGLRRDAARLHAQMQAALVRYYAAQMVAELEQRKVAP